MVFCWYWDREGGVEGEREEEEGRERRGEVDYTEGLLLSLPSNFLWMWTLTPSFNTALQTGECLEMDPPSHFLEP